LTQADGGKASAPGPGAAAPDLGLAREVLQAEAHAVAALVDRLDGGFAEAAGLILACRGTVVASGIGKAGLIARKISATLASTGTPSHFLHPVEALHGDLGRLRPEDLLLALSHSGETDEVVRLVSLVKKLGVRLVSMTGGGESTLARHSDAVLRIGQLSEAGPHGLAPTVSTTAMLALGDALALTVMQMRGFTPDRFAEFHPGGSLGRQLMTVEQAMTFRKDENLPVFSQSRSVREVMHEASTIRRRPGAVLLTDEAGRLAGIFTDADLRRLLAGLDGREGLAVLDLPIERVMTRDPRRVRAGQLAGEALAVFNELRIDELPVVDGGDRPIGLIDVQDMVHLKLL